MDLGATLCRPRKPRCDACPVAAFCKARAAGTAARRPIRRRSRGLREAVFASAIFLDSRGRALLAKRPDKGLLAGMWEFPGAEASRKRGRESARNSRQARIDRAPEGGRIRLRRGSVRTTRTRQARLLPLSGDVPSRDRRGAARSVRPEASARGRALGSGPSVRVSERGPAGRSTENRQAFATDALPPAPRPAAPRHDRSRALPSRRLPAFASARPPDRVRQTRPGRRAHGRGVRGRRAGRSRRGRRAGALGEAREGRRHRPRRSGDRRPGEGRIAGRAQPLGRGGRPRSLPRALPRRGRRRPAVSPPGERRGGVLPRSKARRSDPRPSKHEESRQLRCFHLRDRALARRTRGGGGRQRAARLSCRLVARRRGSRGRRSHGGVGPRPDRRTGRIVRRADGRRGAGHGTGGGRARASDPGVSRLAWDPFAESADLFVGRQGVVARSEAP